MSKFYYESVGECVSQVYEIEATTWEEAKRAAFVVMADGDHLAECQPSAVAEDEIYPEYHHINEIECENYTTLRRGTWAQREPSGREYWEEHAWYFDDDPETLYNGNFEEFTDWEGDEAEIEEQTEKLTRLMMAGR